MSTKENMSGGMDSGMHAGMNTAQVLNDPYAERTEKGVHQFICPNCAAGLQFDPKKQGFTCEYCMSFFTPDECRAANDRIKSDAEEEAPKRTEFEENAQLYSCPSCGAELVTDQNTSATECYYCHNPVVLQGRLSGNFRPSKVIPFKIDRAGAHNIFKTWCKRRWFLPKEFTSESQLLHMQGVSDEEVWEAARYVNADKFIGRLEQGLGEVVRERGNNFSAGQRQLLSFARTIIHKPAVMILDEATANIDTETELLIQDSLERMKNIGTMLIVAHRLSTIQHCDNIILLDQGVIVEQGTHQELLAKHGRYHQLYMLQYSKEQLKNA